MKLGTLLLRDAVISLAQLEAALRAQVLYGGRLGTNLVELDFIDMETLGTYLAQVVGMPLAGKDLFEAVEAPLITSFGAELAGMYTAFPLRYEPNDPGTLAVAFADPRDDASITHLTELCDCGIAAYIAPELRLYYYLEKHYGITRKARFVRTGTRQTAPEEVDERRRTQPAGGIQLPPAVRFEPKKKRKRAATAPAHKRARTGVVRPEPRVSYRQAGDAIDSATHRDQIGEALIGYAVGRFEVAVVFLLRDQNAMGWRLYSARPVRSAVDQISLPLGGISALQAAHDAGEPFRGCSPSAGMPVERQLWRSLEVDADPAEVLVVPVAVRQRVVNLIYVHGFDGEPLQDSLCDELVELGRKASDAYVRLIQRSKATARVDG